MQEKYQRTELDEKEKEYLLGIERLALSLQGSRGSASWGLHEFSVEERSEDRDGHAPCSSLFVERFGVEGQTEANKKAITQLAHRATMIKKNPQMDRLHFNFRRKSKGTSLAQWLIPSRFQFPALESQGIRPLQRRILAEVNCSVPAPFLKMAKFSGSVLQKSASLPPPRKIPKPKHLIPQTTKQLLFRKYLTLKMSVS